MIFAYFMPMRAGQLPRQHTDGLPHKPYVQTPLPPFQRKIPRVYCHNPDQNSFDLSVHRNRLHFGSTYGPRAFHAQTDPNHNVGRSTL